MTRPCVIVDFAMGNLSSIRHKLAGINIPAVISRDPAVIVDAPWLILPGVGHFAEGIANLRRFDLIAPLTEAVQQRQTPLMGICLGMQLLGGWSEEGQCEGLDWIPGKTVRFDLAAQHLRVPHVGWNTIQPVRATPLLAGITADQHFYFMHSYHFVCEDPHDALLTTDYGHRFTSAIQRRHIVGVQFHPEKSHREGLTLFHNFAAAAAARAL